MLDRLELTNFRTFASFSMERLARVIEKLPQGRVVITVNYFRDGQPTVGRGAITWTITAN